MARSFVRDSVGTFVADLLAEQGGGGRDGKEKEIPEERFTASARPNQIRRKRRNRCEFSTPRDRFAHPIQIGKLDTLRWSESGRGDRKKSIFMIRVRVERWRRGARITMASEQGKEFALASSGRNGKLARNDH